MISDPIPEDEDTHIYQEEEDNESEFGDHGDLIGGNDGFGDTAEEYTQQWSECKQEAS